MQSRKFNVVTDAQYGSTGKGLISTYLAQEHRPALLSTTSMANAGHTAVNSNGERFIAKALPAPAILRRWLPGYKPTVLIGPSAAFHLERLLEERTECEAQLRVHPRAGVITQAHRDAEQSLESGTKYLASTMQGCGAFLADKVMRRRELKLAADYPELTAYTRPEEGYDGPLHWSVWIQQLLDMGQTLLHEGSQGFSLDIHHGQSWPYVTSRQTTAVQNLADMGLPASAMGDVYLVLRPYPIRVGSVSENGQVVGYSGGCYPDQQEITWDEVGKLAGMPDQERELLSTRELTTVTRRLRRCFSFSMMQLKEAVAVNGATRLALNFANYIDWQCAHTNDAGKLTDKVWAFIHRLEDAVNVPVTMVGTGPQLNHVIDLS